MASASYHPGPRVGFALALGAVLDGRIADHEGDVGAGFAASGAVTWLALLEKERAPFLLLTLSAGASRTDAVSDDARSHDLTAVDARIGAMVGKTVGPVTAYAAARVFGGPVTWTVAGSEVTGGDAHHYSLGVGASLRLGRRVQVGAEAMGLGERSATGSISLGL